MRGDWNVSIRRACHVFLLDRSTYHYKSRRPGQAALEQRIKDICQTRVRYGYRRVHVLLRREGWHINQKKTRRERIEIFRIVEKANVGRPRAIKRRNIADAPVEWRPRPRLGAGEPDDLLDRQLAVGWEEMRHSASAVDLKLCPCDSEIR